LEGVADGDITLTLDSITFAYRTRKFVKQRCSFSPLDVDEALRLVVIDHVREKELGCVLTS
jgi:hypothetical protein